jgi:hypothetical protein
MLTKFALSLSRRPLISLASLIVIVNAKRNGSVCASHNILFSADETATLKLDS